MNARLMLAALSISAASSLAWSGIADAAPPRLLGDYAFTGSGSCLAVKGPNTPDSPAFDDDLHPNAHRQYFMTTFTVQGVRTFNGDGTGTVEGSSIATSFAQSDGVTLPGAGSRTFKADFTYTISPEGLLTIDTTSYVGTVLSGVHAGETVTIDDFEFTGYASVNNHTITFTTPDTDVVETQEFWNGAPFTKENLVATQSRICHRSRVGTWMGTSHIGPWLGKLPTL